jgi:hypothetical protein
MIFMSGLLYLRASSYPALGHFFCVALTARAPGRHCFPLDLEIVQKNEIALSVPAYFYCLLVEPCTARFNLGVPRNSCDRTETRLAC